MQSNRFWRKPTQDNALPRAVVSRTVLPYLILFGRSRNSDSPSDLRHPLLLTEHNNFHRDEHYQFTNLLCRLYAESRGRLKSFSASSPHSPITKARGAFRRKFRFARRLSCARRWLNCLDMSSDGRKLPSDVRILVLTMSGGTWEAPKDRQASQRVRR